MIITATELQKVIKHDDVKVIDVSHHEPPFQKGEDVYKNSHLPNAVFLDIKEDLTGVNSFMPQPEKLATKLGSLGIANDMKLVLYDRGTNRQVAKAYLVLNYLGHENIAILQGGFPAWETENFEVTTHIPSYEEVTYIPNVNEELVIEIDGIKKRLDDQTSTLIDSRAHSRYTGEEEPRYEKAGHIPGAKNYFSRDVLDDNLWKTEEELKAHFDALEKEEEVIVSCGSGNSACLNFVALKAAGFENIKIYPGGFSEWIQDDENEVVQGDE